MELSIIHIDMDAFYASVEVRENPALRGKPVIIGGKSRRGVVSTASYEARCYGVGSAMPIAKARKLCPNGVYLKPRHSLYKEVSNNIREIFYRYTDLVEPLSLDEAYLDVKQNPKNSIRIAKEIKREIENNLGLTASVGISYNKFLAKLASDFNKPNGFKIISPYDFEELILPLDVKFLWGVGPKTEGKLKEIGLYKIKDIAQADRIVLIDKLGKKGYQIWKLAQGEDNREVTPPSRPKSIGKETTFKKDIGDKVLLIDYLKELCSEVSQRAVSNNIKGRSISLKLKYSDFEEFSKSQSCEYYFNKEEKIYKLALSILKEINLRKKVRLIGITLFNMRDNSIKQLCLSFKKTKK
ncbi:DNA polymerase IV [Halonatronum saccharophilum]|uniref:DNA polymerase IV n=1 Tax=Halonatronum saccharophilum TaxID=150060 RepID=UPI000480C9C1|nr:DNA polymerase IV [Halonatronum saccharophilum]